eukprot:1448122-Alexandrium_andersonii.AAC.1
MALARRRSERRALRRWTQLRGLSCEARQWSQRGARAHASACRGRWPCAGSCCRARPRVVPGARVAAVQMPR